MILHQPYGHDDPYRPLPIERTPRDPEPGERVQVGFQTDPGVMEAWVIFAGERRAAQPLGGGYWVADLGSATPGRHVYSLATPAEQSGPYSFEVGCWLEVDRCQGVRKEPRGVWLELAGEDGVRAGLALSFPLEGVCKADFRVGPLEPTLLEGLPCTIEEVSGKLRVIAEGVEVHLDLATLALAVRGPKGSYHGSAGLGWLALDDGRVTRLRGALTPGVGETLYGLGERFAPLEPTGRYDVRVYEEYKEQAERTYLPVPFLLSSAGYGLWLAAEEPSHFDLGSGTLTLEKLPTPAASFPLYYIVAAEPYGVTAAFVRLTGPIAVPPKWAFGPWMSANTWNSQAKAEDVLRRTREEEVPATVLVLEAWSDETTFYVFNDAEYTPTDGAGALRAEDFRFGGRWPDPKGFIEECHRRGVRVLLWQIPVLKHLEGAHPQHDADVAYALERGYVIRNADGSPYRNKGWWFTDSYVLDFSNPEAREWWFAKRKYLLELGLDGFKTDGGEHLWGRDLRAYDGRRGLELYNAYPNLYVGAYHRFLEAHRPGDSLTFSRAGYTGAQRCPAHWAGDENSTWSAFKASIGAGLSAGVCGVSMWGWDIAGFSGEIPTAELYLRAAAMATFCPIMQYHSELHASADDRDRTPWNIAQRQGDSRALEVFRHYARLRMRLLDYLHAEAEATAALGLPLMRYPGLAYPEAHDFLAGDPYAYLFGRDLLVAPVVEKGASSRTVRLPPGEWIYLWSGARFAGERILSVPAPLERIPVFVRADSPRLGLLLELLVSPPSGEAMAEGN